MDDSLSFTSPQSWTYMVLGASKKEIFLLKVFGLFGKLAVKITEFLFQVDLREAAFTSC